MISEDLSLADLSVPFQSSHVSSWQEGLSKNETRMCLSIEDKLDVCDMASKKMPRTEIMGKYNIGK